MFKIGIYSKSAFSRSGLKQLMQNQGVTEFTTISEARNAAATWRLLVLIVPESDIIGDNAEGRIVGGNDDDRMKVVVVAPKFDFEKMRALFNRGVRGYQLESVSPAVLQATLELVALGEVVMPSSLAEGLAGSAKDSEQVLLSPKELIVVRWLVEGQANKEISRSLGIAESTTKVHVKAIMRKLDVSSRTQAAIWAVRSGLAQTVMQPRLGVARQRNTQAPGCK